MQSVVLKTIVNAFNCASEDPTRYQLNSVSVTGEKTRVIVQATDGHILSRVEIEDELASEIGTKRFLVSRDQLPALKAILKSHRYIPVPTAWNDRGYLVIGLQELSGCQVEIKFETQREYPNVDQLWPSRDEIKWKIRFNPQLLCDLHKAMSDGTKATETVRLEISDALSPIIVTCGENRGVLMPARD